jgi:hypothetical protein
MSKTIWLKRGILVLLAGLIVTSYGFSCPFKKDKKTATGSSGTVTPPTTTTGSSGDNYANTYSTATLISAGSSTAGTISPSNDVDFFRFSASANSQYTISITLGTLGDSVLYLYGTNGTTLITSNDDYNGNASRIVWTCTSNGTYYIKVSGYESDDTGTYTLVLTAGGGTGTISNGTMSGTGSYAGLIYANIVCNPNSGPFGTPVTITVTFTLGGSYVNAIKIYQKLVGGSYNYVSGIDPVKQSANVWVSPPGVVLYGTSGWLKFAGVNSSGTEIVLGIIEVNDP